MAKKYEIGVNKFKNYFLRPEKVAFLFINVEPKIESTKFDQLN